MEKWRFMRRSGGLEKKWRFKREVEAFDEKLWFLG